MNSPKTLDHTAKIGIKWVYNPPEAPHWGGFWERLVKSVKAPLKKILKNTLLMQEQLDTVICQIERQINSRPLMAVSDEIGFVPITPADILIGRKLGTYPDASLPNAAKNDIVKRWRYRQAVERQFWDKRQKEYLPTLQQHQKWQNK